MDKFIAAISMINIDILYEGLARMPGLGEEEIAQNCEIMLGGGAVASLVQLARLGVDVRLGTFLANDMMSGLAREKLDENHVRYCSLSYKDSNPVAITSIASFPNDRSFISYFPNHGKISCTDEEVYTLYSGAKICVGIEGHTEVFRKLRQEKTKVVFDVGWRNDLNLDTYKEMLSTVDYFMPNELEAMKMTETSTPERALDVLSGYVPHAIVKLGKNGCITKIAGETVAFPALSQFRSVDTTGAGDAFMGGLMYGLFMDWDIRKCIAMGNVVGGYSTTQYGCIEAKLSLDKAMKYLNA